MRRTLWPVVMLCVGCGPATHTAVLAPEPEAGAPAGSPFERLAAEGRTARVASGRGAPMPARLAEAWGEALDLTDDAVPRWKVADLVKARLTLEGELELTSEHFGDLPGSLGERIPATLHQLSARLTALSERPRKADPKHFLWPTSPVVVNSPWGDRMHPIHGEVRFHAGVDLGAEKAQAIHAAAAGTVLFAGWNGAHGKQIEVQHDAHLTTRYSHLMTLLVEPGREVKRGEVIGLAGQTGQATGPHLHFEVRVDGESVDPEAVLPPPPVEAQALGVLR